MKFFDTHAHYNDSVYDANLEEILKKCKEANVTHIVNVGYNKESSQKAIELARKYDHMYATIGVHPHDVTINTAQDIYDVYHDYREEKIVAIGEIGLDYAFVKDNKEEQFQLLIEQIELANTLKLPICIHTRDASFDTYRILKEKKPAYGVLLHCFKPTDDLMKLVLEDGYYVAFGGNITYKRSKSFGSYLKKIPISQIVLETDSPYLAPIPYKGEVNNSANLPLICDKLAEYVGLLKDVVARKVYQNSLKFYHIVEK